MRVAAPVIGLVAVLVVAAPARAGTYTVHSCKTPAGTYANGADWPVTKQGSGGERFGSSCPRGPFWLDMRSARGHLPADYMRAVFRAPADTAILAYTIWRSVQVGESYGYRAYELTRSGGVVKDLCTAPCARRGSVSPPLDPGNEVSGGGLTGVTGLGVEIACVIAKGCADTAESKLIAARLQVHRADITLLDRAAPVLTSPPSGPLVDPGRTLTGIVPVTLSASDRGGGVFEALFEVDGRVVGSATLDPDGGRCARPFVYARPCKASASGTVGLDTSTVPDGRHALRILVSDATGTNTAAWGPIQFRTANAACNPRPRAAGGTRLRVAIAGRSGRLSVTTRYGRGVLVRGRLLDAAGAPLANAPICVATRARSSLHAGRTLVTDAAGRFVTTLRRGPSRRVYFVHREPGGAVSAAVRVRVRAPVRLRASRRSLANGDRVAFRGRVGGRPRGGVLVELQARRPDGWHTFSTTHARRGGRFRSGYHFVRTAEARSYRFRARVPRQPGHPYATGTSRPIVVRVNG